MGAHFAELGAQNQTLTLRCAGEAWLRSCLRPAPRHRDGPRKELQTGVSWECVALSTGPSGAAHSGDGCVYGARRTGNGPELQRSASRETCSFVGGPRTR